MKIEPIKAWAVVNSADRIHECLFVDEGQELLIFRKKETALKRRIKNVGDKVISIKLSPLK